ncbi:MAG: LD-carboxypeptidase [Desulfobulbus sp.]|nr:LD-carboxypeptidase [Desulfobulbus sp.]
MPEQLIRPPWLRRGDTIGLFCPAGPVRDPARLQAGIKRMQDLGFETKICGSVGPMEGYLAAGDSQRAANLHALWSDETVKAILAVRGGFGCLRMVELLDWDLFRRQPKWLVGFSDVTVLLQGLYQRSQLVSIHGPVASTLTRSDEASLHSLFSLLTGDFEERLRPKSLEVLRGGNSRGALIGGNLTTLVHLLATPWDCSWEGKILLLEDTNEPLYRLDRMLTQLALSGKLAQLAGIILGEFDQGEGSLANLRLQEALWSRLMELVGPGYPVWSGFPVGHCQRNLALPIGMEVEMDSASGSLNLITASVASV